MLDRPGGERDERDLAAVFEDETSKLDRKAVDQALSGVDWQAQVVASVKNVAARQRQRRFGSLVVAMDSIRDERDGLERAQRQGSPVVEVQRREDELRRARETYQRLLGTGGVSALFGVCPRGFGAVTRNADRDEVRGIVAPCHASAPRSDRRGAIRTVHFGVLIAATDAVSRARSDSAVECRTRE